jgi:hypothetical protein
MPRNILLMAFRLSCQPPPLTMSRPAPFDGYRKHPRSLPRTMLLPHGAYCYVHISMAYATWEDQTLYSQACFNTT